MTDVPTIDLRAITKDSLELIDNACRDHGFFLLTGHGLEQNLENLSEQAKVFFSLPRETKLEAARTKDNPTGYYDRELTKQKRDQKEVFDYFATLGVARRTEMNWPRNQPVFKAVLTDYFSACDDLSARILQLLCDALGVDGDQLAGAFGRKATSSARLNHYPDHDPVANNERAGVAPLGNMALHHHTDPGALTLLFQDAVGGLQTHSNQHGWVDVPPVAGAIVVNIGDILQVWSNDLYKAALHRVLPVPDGKQRFSMPFFYQPRGSAIIAPLNINGPAKYSPFSWRDFIQGRIDDNYADSGAEDIQIDRYRIAS